VVHDGDLTITAERPDGSADTVKVTVDDGTGKSTSYDLDYSGDDAPTATPHHDAPTATPHHGEAQAMYRPLEHRLDGVINHLDAQQHGAALEHDAAAQSPIDRDPAGQYATSSDPAGQHQQSYAATSPQASFNPGGGSSFFGDSGGEAAGQAGAFGTADHGQYAAAPSGGPGEAGLASAGGDNGGADGAHHGGPAHQGQQSGAMAGMPVMGGGGGAGDQDRGAGAQWRAAGDLFDDEAAGQAGAFGEGR
jgi:hypothetical protein